MTRLEPLYEVVGSLKSTPAIVVFVKPVNPFGLLNTNDFANLEVDGVLIVTVMGSCLLETPCLLMTTTEKEFPDFYQGIRGWNFINGWF